MRISLVFQKGCLWRIMNASNSSTNTPRKRCLSASSSLNKLGEVDGCSKRSPRYRLFKIKHFFDWNYQMVRKILIDIFDILTSQIFEYFQGTMGIVPTDIIFAGSTFLLYSYSSKNFQANWVNKTNATGSALSHTTCPKGFGWPSLLGKIFFWSKSESWHGLILLSITQIFLLSAAQILDGVRIPQVAKHFFHFLFIRTDA